eukprot:scaffold399401_cov24-Prasinocladus_malaysianus.AAC.1
MDSGLVAHIHYMCPFVSELRSPLAPPAQLMLRWSKVSKKDVVVRLSMVNREDIVFAFTKKSLK